MIKFYCVYEQQSNMGDSLYNVILDKEYTVNEFIQAILRDRPNERGDFGIYDGESYSGDPKITYWHGKLRSQFPDIFLNEKITKVKAAGSWGVIDYVIHINSERIGELESESQKKRRVLRERWKKAIGERND